MKSEREAQPEIILITNIPEVINLGCSPSTICSPHSCGPTVCAPLTACSPDCMPACTPSSMPRDCGPTRGDPKPPPPPRPS